jgi:hypothetical protein
MKRNGDDVEGDADHMIPKGYAAFAGINTIRAQDLDSSTNRSYGASIDKRAKNEWGPDLLELSKSLLPDDPAVSDRWRLAPLTTALYRAHKDNAPIDLDEIRERIVERSMERNSDGAPGSTK